MSTKPYAVALTCAVILTACSDSPTIDLHATGDNGPANAAFSASVPEHLSSLRALDLDSLYAEVTINGELQVFEQGSTITTTFSVNEGDVLDLQIQWFEAHESEAALLLSSWSGTEQVTDDVSISVTSDDYQTDGDAFDFDSDGYSNLLERRADSDPRDLNSTPENVPDVRIRWVNPTEAPVIDGLYDSIWNNAQFSDTRGEQLRIDNLMINQGATRPDGDTEFRWFALHDDIFLYVFILGENVDTGTPIRDSSDVWQDDTANLFIDGNDSKGSSYDGFDDRHVLVPLLTSPDNPVSNSTVFVVGENSADFTEIEFGTCLCSAGQHTWEFKLPLSQFNIQKNVPFGFDVQLDEDNDGGARDARWGWFHPSRTTSDVDNTWMNPSFMGTAVLE